MAELKNAVPVDLFEPMFKKVREKVIATNVSEFLKNKPKQVPSISLFIWDEMVHRGAVPNHERFKIAPIINNEFKGVYKFIKKELGKEPISDIYAVEYFNEVVPNDAFVEVALAQCFPNDIHIIDVEFSDNRRPIGQRDPTREFRTYKGLHVFGEFLDRLREVARGRGIERISLIVAWPPLHNVFIRYGFRVSETEMAQRGHKIAGHGYSMYLPVG